MKSEEMPSGTNGDPTQCNFVDRNFLSDTLVFIGRHPRDRISPTSLICGYN